MRRVRNNDLLSSVLFLLGSWWCANVAHAQERRDDAARSSAAARALFHEGVVCADARDWTCAADRFGRARAVRPSPVISSNLGIALEHRGRYVEASEAFRSLLHDPSAPADLRASAQAAIERITPRIGTLTVVANGPTEGVALTIDGVALEPSLLGIAVPSDPGAHRLEARRDGALVASETVQVTSGGHARIDVALPAREPRHDVSTETIVAAPIETHATHVDSETVLAADPTVTPTSRHEVYEEWWFWTIIGIVVVGAGAGVTAAVVTSNDATLPSGSLGTIDVRP
jgi:hypothetical protein